MTGPLRATVADISDDNAYVRIDTSEVRWSQKPGTRADLYFPTLTPPMPWEKHPFSVMPTVMLRPPLYSGKTTENSSLEHSHTA
jgi:hypothetical protein